MRVFPPIAFAAGLAVSAGVSVAPASAQEKEKTTIEWVTTKSVVMKVGGYEIPVTYTPDGKFSAQQGQVHGKWWVVGDTLCTVNNVEQGENCILYPSGKKPGDEFPIMSPQGEVVIAINK